MIISDSHRLVFIHIPKTGGSAVTHELATLGVWNLKELTRGNARGWQTFYHRKDKYLMHCGVNMLRPEHRDYLRFAVVRSPFTWALSHFNKLEKKAGRESTPENFRAWLALPEPPLLPSAIGRHQHCWIDDQTRILRFETLAADLAALMAEVGVMCHLGPPIPGQESVSSRAREFYNAEAERRVVDLWREDFERFGYPEVLG